MSSNKRTLVFVCLRKTAKWSRPKRSQVPPPACCPKRADPHRACFGPPGKLLNEAAAVTSVKLCKIATYINTSDSNNVVFLLVQNVINDLKVRRMTSFTFSWC